MNKVSAMVDSAAIVELRDVTKTFHRGTEEVHAVNHVNLSIARGEFVAIVGASGSGKSTLLHLMGCMDVPTSGTILLEGMKTGQLTERELTEIRRQKVGFIFQQFFLLPTLTALENVCIPALFAHKGNSIERAEMLLGQLGLGNRIHHRPSEMSGGEMQRVAIARALMNNPHLLLADEPTGNLDSVNAESIYEILRTLHNDGLTIIVVTHNQQLATHAQRMLTMRDGCIDPH